MLKIKLSFLLLFLVMHSQNALSIKFNINLSPDPDPYPELDYTKECCHMLTYNSDTESVYDWDLCYGCGDSFDCEIKKLKEVFSTIVKDMLDAQVTFSGSGESLPRSTELDRMVNIANGSSLEYRFTVTQSLGSVIEGGNFPSSVPVRTYQATLSIPDLEDVYTIVGEEESPETHDEDAVEETPDESTVEVTPDENPVAVEPTTSHFENTPYTLPRLNPSWWERLTNPLINLLFQWDSR